MRAVALLLLLASSTQSVAADVVFRCSNIKGTMLAAPSWTVNADGFGQKEVLLGYRDASQGEVRWSDGLAYSGLGVAMNGGFAIIALGEEFIETFVVNVGSGDLLMTAVRTSSGLLPNSSKAFRGTCQPAGNEVRR